MFQDEKEWRFRERGSYAVGRNFGRDGSHSWTEDREAAPWHGTRWNNDAGFRGREYADRQGRTFRECSSPEEEQDVYDELRYRVQHGEDLLLCGVPSYPGKIVRALFRERGNYMRDIQTDEEGFIRRINFIRVD